MRILFFILCFYVFGGQLRAQENFRLMRWSGITSAGLTTGTQVPEGLHAGYTNHPVSDLKSFYLSTQVQLNFFRRSSAGLSFQRINKAGVPSMALEAYGKFRGAFSRKLRYELTASIGLAEKYYYSAFEHSSSLAAALNPSPKQTFVRGGMSIYSRNLMFGYLYRTSVGLENLLRSHVLRLAGNLRLKKFSPWSFTPGILMEWNNNSADSTQFMLQSGLLLHYKNFHAGPLYKTDQNLTSLFGARFGYQFNSWQIRTTAAVQDSIWQIDLDILYIYHLRRSCRRWYHPGPYIYF